MKDDYILQVFNDSQDAIRVVIFVVYGASTGHDIYQQLHEAYVSGDSERIKRVIHQLWLDADDTASFIQDSVWDAITVISDSVAGTRPELEDLLLLNKDNVIVEAELLHNDERDNDV